MRSRTVSGTIAAVLSCLLSGAIAAQTPAAEPAGVPNQQPASASASATVSQAAAEPGSDVRIIRLSQVKGAVQMDRNTGRGYEQAFANLPVVQGAKLKTGEGVAEVEFEDNSTLRLTPNTEVDFPKLRLDPTGVTLTTIHVLRGTVYASQTGHKSNSSQFTITFAEANRVTLPANSHVLLTVDSPSPRLAVFEGTVAVEYASAGGTASTTVGKKHSLLFDPTAATSPTLLARVDAGPYDGWDKDAVGYHKRYSNASAFGSSPGYGVSDLNYYGSFVSLAGCGSVWRPYFTSAAWDPFANGVWAWYPGAGYSWVSPYPWGWAPFHAGSWQQCGTEGWGWRPGGQWVGLRNSEKCPDRIHGPTHLRPPLPPAPGHPTMVAINTRPIAASRLTGSDTFVFSKDSAGFGVPRQTFGKLSSTSANVAHHGAVVTPVYPTQASMAARSSDQPIAVHPSLAGHSDPDHAQGQAFTRGQDHSAAHTPSAISTPVHASGAPANTAHGNWTSPSSGSSRGEWAGGGYTASSGGSSSGGGHSCGASAAPSAPAASSPSAAPAPAAAPAAGRH